MEGRPDEGGRNVIVRAGADGRVADVTPPPFNARTRVHEYGGGAFAVAGGDLVFAHFADQRLYRLDVAAGGPAPPLTQDSQRPRRPPPALRRHRLRRAPPAPALRPRGPPRLAAGSRAGRGPQPENAVVAVDLAGAARTARSRGRRPAGARLRRGLLRQPPPQPGRRPPVPGSPGTTPTCPGTAPSCGSATSPRTARSPTPGASPAAPRTGPPARRSSSRSGARTAASTSSPTAPAGGTSTAWARATPSSPLAPMEAEFGQPQWVFGIATYGFARPADRPARRPSSAPPAGTASGAWGASTSPPRPPGSRRHPLHGLPQPARPPGRQRRGGAGSPRRAPGARPRPPPGRALRRPAPRRRGRRRPGLPLHPPRRHLPHRPGAKRPTPSTILRPTATSAPRTASAPRCW